MLTKEFLIECAQGIVNFYDGEYGEVKEINKGFSKHDFCFENKGWFKYDTNGVFYYKNEELLLYVKGTDKNFDWLSNLLPGRRGIPYEGVNSKIRVRQGFLDGYKVMREWWLDKVKRHKTIKLIAHSRGVPIAKLAAVDCQYHNPDKQIMVIGFGSPATGNKYFEDSYIKRVPQTYLFRYGLDIVTYVPFLGYKNSTQIKTGKPTIPVWNGWDHRPDKYLRGMMGFQL